MKGACLIPRPDTMKGVTPREKRLSLAEGRRLCRGRFATASPFENEKRRSSCKLVATLKCYDPFQNPGQHSPSRGACTPASSCSWASGTMHRNATAALTVSFQQLPAAVGHIRFKPHRLPAFQKTVFCPMLIPRVFPGDVINSMNASRLAGSESDVDTGSCSECVIISFLSSFLHVQIASIVCN